MVWAEGMLDIMVWAEGMLDAIERAGWGALLIDADGCVISLNDEARRHVGSEITLAQGQIAAMHRTANAELKHRIAATLNGPLPAARGGVLLSRRDGRPVMAYVISIAEPGSGSPSRAKAIVVLIELPCHHPLSSKVRAQVNPTSVARAR
jgi:hypothetical protein